MWKRCDVDDDTMVVVMTIETEEGDMGRSDGLDAAGLRREHFSSLRLSPS